MTHLNEKTSAVGTDKISEKQSKQLRRSAIQIWMDFS